MNKKYIGRVDLISADGMSSCRMEYCDYETMKNAIWTAILRDQLIDITVYTDDEGQVGTPTGFFESMQAREAIVRSIKIEPMPAWTTLEVGSKVIAISTEEHEREPDCYPKPGTLGVVTAIWDETEKELELGIARARVKWADGSTSADDEWRENTWALAPLKD